MKVKQMAKWFWEDSRFSFIVLFIVLFTIYLLQLIGRLLPVGLSVNISASDVACLITVFVVGIVQFAGGFGFGCVNGVSRKSVFLGYVAASFLIGAVVSVGNLILTVIDFAVPGTSGTGGLYGMSYRTYMADQNLLLNGVTLLVFMVFGAVFMLLVGYFVGGVFYRLGKVGRVLWAVGLPMGTFVILPSAFTFLPAGLQAGIAQALSGLQEWMTRSPYYCIFFFIGGIILLGITDWLLIRRAPLKASA